MSLSMLPIMPIDVRTSSKPLLPAVGLAASQPRGAFLLKSKASPFLLKTKVIKGRAFPLKTNVIKASIDSSPSVDSHVTKVATLDTLATQTQTNSSPEPQLSTDGGGGNMGNNINLGGGGGGGSDGGAGDDGYLEDFDIGNRRYVYVFVSRSLRKVLRRAYLGRMGADPTFLYKLLLEQAITIGCSVSCEIKNRKERIKQEWHLALLNVLTVTACNSIVVWSLAPCYSLGFTYYFDWKKPLQKLPNNIFGKSYLLRNFDLQKRILSFFYKAAELYIVGFTVGAVQGVCNLLGTKKEGRLSVTAPCVISNALGYGAFLGLHANLRYQLLCGFDRNYFDVSGVALFFSSTALRVLNVQAGEASRLAWLGIKVDQLAHPDDPLKEGS